MVLFTDVRECAGCAHAIAEVDGQWVHFDPERRTTTDCPRTGAIPKAAPKPAQAAPVPAPEPKAA